MLRKHPNKPCKHCGQSNHYPYQCYKNPNRKQITTKGKTTKQWFKTRDTWIRNNPPNHQGYWPCYLQIAPNCLVWLTKSTLTLDHVKSRSRHPELRFDQSNLQPCCGPCNTLKGSKDAEMLL